MNNALNTSLNSLSQSSTTNTLPQDLSVGKARSFFEAFETETSSEGLSVGDVFGASHQIIFPTEEDNEPTTALSQRAADSNPKRHRANNTAFGNGQETASVVSFMDSMGDVASLDGSHTYGNTSASTSKSGFAASKAATTQPDLSATRTLIATTSTPLVNHKHRDDHDPEAKATITLEPRPISMARSWIVPQLDSSSLLCTREEQDLLHSLFPSSRAANDESKPLVSAPKHHIDEMMQLQSQSELTLKLELEFPPFWPSMQSFPLQTADDHHGQPLNPTDPTDPIQLGHNIIEVDLPHLANQLDQTTFHRFSGARFHRFQADQWEERFRELVHFKRDKGHCLVPCSYPQDVALARWVKRQRHQFKRMLDGASSTMTEDRRQRLEDVGFVWDSQKLVWEERCQELVAFREKYGHCNVTNANCGDKPHLMRWVKYQRRHAKSYINSLVASEAERNATAPAPATATLRSPTATTATRQASVSVSAAPLVDAGASNPRKSTIMSEERIQKLNAIGFVWITKSTRGV